MYNKFENEKAPRKNTKGPPWYDRTLHKTEHLIESLFMPIYFKSSICLNTVYLCCLLINKVEAKFLRFFCQKKKTNIRVRIKPSFTWNFETCLQIQSLILIGYSSPTTLRQIPASWKPRLKWHVLRKIKERLFSICPARTGPLQTFPHLRARKSGLVPAVNRGYGIRSNWTIHKMQNWNRTADHSFEFLFMQVMTWKTEQNL